MRSISCIANTGFGPNLLQEDLNKPDWLLFTRRCHSPQLEPAISQLVEAVQTIVLHVLIKESGIGFIFRIIRNMLASVIEARC